MDRHLAAYLLIAVIIAGLAAAIARARYYSRDNVLKRRRLVEAAARDRKSANAGPGPA